MTKWLFIPESYMLQHKLSPLDEKYSWASLVTSCALVNFYKSHIYLNKKIKKKKIKTNHVSFQYDW